MYISSPRIYKERKREKGRKEGNALFNDALNTYYLWLYGIGYMVKDHSDSERGNLLPPHTTGFVTPVVEHWLE